MKFKIMKSKAISSIIIVILFLISILLDIRSYITDSASTLRLGSIILGISLVLLFIWIFIFSKIESNEQ